MPPEGILDTALLWEPFNTLRDELLTSLLAEALVFDADDAGEVAVFPTPPMPAVPPPLPLPPQELIRQLKTISAAMLSLDLSIFIVSSGGDIQ